MHKAYFDSFVIELTTEQALRGSIPGKDADHDIRYLLTVPNIARQLNAISTKDIAAELQKYGAWDEEELKDDDLNRKRILWIACGYIRDEL